MEGGAGKHDIWKVTKLYRVEQFALEKFKPKETGGRYEK